MTKNFISILAAALIAPCFSACSPEQPQEESMPPITSTQPETPVAIDMAHNSMNSLDWEGKYSGVIPAASGPGIEATITLRRDSTYTAKYHYIDRPEGDFDVAGAFTWNQAGQVITLDTQEIPPYYQVGEGRLTQLDMAVNLITGELAENYVLSKQP